MSFSFEFTGDDIEAVPDTGSAFVDLAPSIDPQPEITIGVPDVPVLKHDLRDMLSTLPSRISYTTTLVTSSLNRHALIPRRALFDVRLQIMAESPMSTDNTTNTTKSNDSIGVNGDSDIERNVYEGGFKSWEGALDLARFVLDRGPRKDVDEIAGLDGIVELGAGTALPSLILFQHALKEGYTMPFTLADYNASVLRLVTIPNQLLVWALQHSPTSFSPQPPSLAPTTNSAGPALQDADGDLEITPELLSAFMSHTSQNNPITLLSGPWSPPLSSHLLSATTPKSSLLILASEVLYSPSSLHSFSRLLAEVLGKVKAGKALVAGKRVYFGVGGGVGEFKEVMAGLGGVVSEVAGAIEEGESGSGVGRAILEVQMF